MPPSGRAIVASLEGGRDGPVVEITLETTNTTAIDVPDAYLLNPQPPPRDIELDGPASLEPNTTKSYTHTARAGATLSPSSTYELVVAESGTGRFDNVYWRHTASTAEDAASAPGWTIGDEGGRGGLNSVDPPPLLLRVNGSPVVSHAEADIQVSFGAAEYTAAESGTAVAVNLSRARPFTVEIPLELASSNGGAGSGDHSAIPATLTFAGGETSGSFAVRAIDDADDDDGEYIVLGFGDLPAGYAAAIVVLEDDDGHRALVSNLRQAREGSYGTWFQELAQGFETGPNPHGYALTGVDLNITSNPNDMPSPEVEVPRMRVVSGSPEAAGGVALAGPASLAASHNAIRVYRFTAPPETYLDGTTKYWIVADGSGPGGTDVYWSFTHSPDEDPGSGSGWRIDNGSFGRLYGSGTPFALESDIDPLMLAVLGTPLDAPYNRPATGEPGLAGLIFQDKTLTAEVPGTIEDGNGLTSPAWTYQWIRTLDGVDEEIPAATGATYVLAAADASYTIRVRVSFTDDDGFAESRDSASTTVVPPGVADTSGIATVAADWTLIPPESNIGPGGQFRLMFVTGDPKATGDAREPFERIDATFTDINIYNEVVQVAALDGHAAIRNYAGHFRALASTAAVNARTNTATAASDTDTRIYWLGHRGSADDSIADFYDGTRWKKVGIQQDEDGNEVRMGLNDFVWTGTNQDGTTSSAPLGSANPTVAEPNRNFGQMNNNETKANTNEYPLYALSMVFEVAQAGSGLGQPGGGVALAAKAGRRSAVPDGQTPGATGAGGPAAAEVLPGNDGDAANLDGAAGAAAVSVTARDRSVEILFDAPLDATARPAPGDFAVEADGALRAIISVRVGPDRVVLELAAPLAAGERVEASYPAPGAHPVRTSDGAVVAPLYRIPVTVGGAPGATAGLPRVRPSHAGAAQPHTEAAPDGPLRPGVPAARAKAAALAFVYGRHPELDRVPDGALAAAFAEALAAASADELNALGALRADRRGIAVLSGIRRATGLREIDLGGNAVSDLAPLEALDGLRRLDLAGNAVEDLWPLADLTRLRRLDLANARSSDVSPLGDLSALVWLDLSGSPLSDPLPLGRLAALRWLFGGRCGGARLARRARTPPEACRVCRATARAGDRR